jgi:hypothetical protein
LVNVREAEDNGLVPQRHAFFFQEFRGMSEWGFFGSNLYVSLEWSEYFIKLITMSEFELSFDIPFLLSQPPLSQFIKLIRIREKRKTIVATNATRSV